VMMLVRYGVMSKRFSCIALLTYSSSYYGLCNGQECCSGLNHRVGLSTSCLQGVQRFCTTHLLIIPPKCIFSHRLMKMQSNLMAAASADFSYNFS